MKTNIVFFTAIVCLICSGILSAQTSEKRNVTAFSQIKSMSPIDIEYVQGSKYSVEVTAKDNELLQSVETKVEGDMLYLSIKGKFIGKVNTEIKVKVSAPSIRSVSLSGSSDFKAILISNVPSFSIASTGSSDVSIDRLQVSKDLNIAASGSSDVILKSVEAVDVNFAATGSSDIKINSLVGASLNLAISGGSDAVLTNVNLSGNLNIAAKGSSDAKIKGKANIVTVVSEGSSDVDVSGLTYNKITDKSSGDSTIKK